MRDLLALAVVLCLVIAGAEIIYAAQVDVPVVCQGLEGKVEFLKGEETAFGISIAGEMDSVSERELSDADDGEAEANFLIGKLIFAGAKGDLYLILGQAQDIEYSYKTAGANVKYELGDEFIWGVGFSALVYEWGDGSNKLFVDAKYREMDDINYESVTVDGVQYNKSQLAVGSKDAKWQEAQLALGVARQFKQFLPYVGIKYSDIGISGKAVIGTTTYDLGSNDSKNYVGMFIGCSITPMKVLAIDLQGRFIDETAFSVKATYRF